MKICVFANRDKSFFDYAILLLSRMGHLVISYTNDEYKLMLVKPSFDITFHINCVQQEALKNSKMNVLVTNKESITPLLKDQDSFEKLSCILCRSMFAREEVIKILTVHGIKKQVYCSKIHPLLNEGLRYKKNKNEVMFLHLTSPKKYQESNNLVSMWNEKYPLLCIIDITKRGFKLNVPKKNAKVYPVERLRELQVKCDYHILICDEDNDLDLIDQSRLLKRLIIIPKVPTMSEYLDENSAIFIDKNWENLDKIVNDCLIVLPRETINEKIKTSKLNIRNDELVLANTLNDILSSKVIR